MASGIDAAPREARLLWEAAGGEPVWAPTLIRQSQRAVAQRFRRLVEARCRHVPLAYLTRSVGFLDIEVSVRPGVFIPRPETEELAERAVNLLRGLPAEPRVLDLGTGSGAIACVLARTRPDVHVLATDLAPRALACAQQNARRLGLTDRIDVRRSDWLSAVHEQFHLVTANPPYIAWHELAPLQPEIRCHEPRRALESGADGLRDLHVILRQLPRCLLPGGYALLEIGHRQGDAVRALAKEALGLVETEVYQDMGGRARILAVRWM